jgi:hypothetical protein
MKCPLCVKEGRESTIACSGGGIRTDMAPRCFYDKNGEYHRHDRNSYTEGMRCSNGHEMIRVTRYGCDVSGCDFRPGSVDIKVWVDGNWEVMR